MERPLALLLRPHPFMVDQMSKFLEGVGFQPLRTPKPSELGGLQGRALAVISLAVNSEAPLSIAQAYAAGRGCPIVRATLFTGLAARDSAQRGLDAELGTLGLKLVQLAPGLKLGPKDAPYATPSDLSGAPGDALAAWLRQVGELGAPAKG